MDNLGQILAAHGLTTTTWFDGSGQTTSHGTFNSAVRLFDDQGTEVPGALQKRMGMPSGVSDFQPGYGHAQRQALFAGMVQRALDAGWFVQFGIPAGTRVDGATKTSGYNPEFLQDVAYLLTSERANSEIVKKFADVQQPFDGPPQQLASNLTDFFAKKHKNHPSRTSPLAYTDVELAAAGIAPTEAGRDLFYSFIAKSLLNEIAAGTTNPNAEPADANYSFVTVDVPTFLRWTRAREAGSAMAAKAAAAAGPAVAASKRSDGTQVWSVQADGLDREGLLALAQSLLGKALGQG